MASARRPAPVSTACLLVAGIAGAGSLLLLRAFGPQQLSGHLAAITVDYPADGSVFPPEITPPTFLWRDAAANATSWTIDITFRGPRSRHPREIVRRADAHRRNRSGNRFAQQRTSQADPGAGGRAHLDARCRYLGGDQETFRGIAGHHRDHRVSRRGPEAAGLQRPGENRDFPRPGRGADLLSRRAADAQSGRQRRDQAAGARGDWADQVEAALSRRAAQPGGHAEDLDVRQLPFLLRRRQDAGTGRGRTTERPRACTP